MLTALECADDESDMSVSMPRFRTWPLLAALLLASAVPISAQTYAQVRVVMSHPQAIFTVDGTQYVGSATFSWPAGSRHTLGIFGLVQFIGDGRSPSRFKAGPATTTCSA